MPLAAAVRAYVAEFPTVPAPGRGDAAVLRAALRLRATVVTADRALAERLRLAGLDTVQPRDRARLVLRRGERTRSPRRGGPPRPKG